MLGRIVGRVSRSLANLRFRHFSGKAVQAGQGVQLYGFPILMLHPDSNLTVGDGAVLCSSSRHTAMALNHPIKLSTLRAGSRISIGAGAGISGGTIVAAESIDIGCDVLLGANVTIVDTDFHPIAAKGRRHSDDPERIATAPVWIGDNVFIGAGATILKGVRIGRDSVVGAGAVVRGEFPDRSILAGNPAKVIGQVPD